VKILPPTTENFSMRNVKYPQKDTGDVAPGMSVSWIGDRVDMAFRCVNTGGDGGFKFFCERDEDDFKQTDSETIRIGPFTLTPSEFYLYSGNAIDIYVSFNPD